MSRGREGQRRWPWVVLGVTVLVIGGLGLAVVLAGRSRPASGDDALDRFRRDGPSPAAGGAVRPGVYPSTIDATESVGFGPLDRHTTGAVPVTVTTADSCQVVRVDVDADHWRNWRLCTTDGGPALAGGDSVTARSFPGISYRSTTSVTCVPPVRPGPGGTTATGSCRSVSSGGMSGGGEDRVVLVSGPGPRVSVGGDEVQTTRLVVDGTLSGGQSGTERLEFLFERDSGLVVQIRYDTAVRADTTIGTIDYRDRGTVTLTASSPRT